MLQRSELAQFTGTENWHRYSPHLFPTVLLTDGAKYVAENGGHGAYWLMDAIASYQRELLKKHAWASQMQFWTLTVEGSAAVLECREDSDKSPAVRQLIEYTDFDLDSIKLWVAPVDGKNYCIMLPTEY